MPKYINVRKTLAESQKDSQFDPISGSTKFVKVVEVRSLKPTRRTSFIPASRASNLSEGGFKSETTSNIIDVETKVVSQVKIWRGRVIEIKESSFIAQLFESSNLRNKTRVEISSSFPGIGDIKSYELFSQFVIEQVNVEGEVKTSIRKSEIAPKSYEVRKQIVSARMKEIAYLFGEEDNV